MTQDFEPRIIGFLCNWCSYAGADLCGVSRYQYPTNIRIVRVMCSTRIDPVHILEVLKAGADGVLVGGCHLGDCHYITGNYHTVNKFDLTKKILEKTGLEVDRIKLEWVSASEGERFSKVITEFTNEIKGLGPTPVKENEDLQFRIQAAIDAVGGERLRTLVGKQYMVTDVATVYGEKVEKEEMERIIDETVDGEFYRSLLLRKIITEPKSVKQLAQEINIPAYRVLEYITFLRRENKIGDAGHEGLSPLYTAIKAGGE